MAVYFVITKTGNRHEIEAKNADEANRKAEAEFGYANIAVAPQESLRKPATDRTEVPHKFQPMPGNKKPTLCNICLERKEHELHRLVKDSFDRARLHRVLDAVIDRVRGRDESKSLAGFKKEVARLGVVGAIRAQYMLPAHFINEILTSGVASLQDFRKAGIEASFLKTQGFRKADLLSAGYSEAEASVRIR